MVSQHEAGVVSSAGVVSLVQQAQAGDARAFEQLYRENVGRVYALCLRLSADPARAEELTQDVFVRAWEKLGSFRGESAFSSWLHRLATNVVLGARRSTGRRSAREIEVEDLNAVMKPARGSDPGSRMDLERAISHLPDGTRTVFVMYEVEGYAHAEIAELTGRAEGTCKALLHRARKLLREALQ
jgi:RNA polymerase sigma factor (sigma-70 family)